MHLSSLDCVPHVLQRLILLVLITGTIFGYGHTKVLLMQSPPIPILVHNLKWTLPSTSLLVHYSPLILSLDYILSELASAPCMLHSSPTSIIHPVHSITPIEMVLIVRPSVRLFQLGNRWTSFDTMRYQQFAI